MVIPSSKLSFFSFFSGLVLLFCFFVKYSLLRSQHLHSSLHLLIMRFASVLLSVALLASAVIAAPIPEPTGGSEPQNRIIQQPAQKPAPGSQPQNRIIQQTQPQASGSQPQNRIIQQPAKPSGQQKKRPAPKQDRDVQNGGADLAV